MRHHLSQFADCLLRGFGQLCLANNRVSGLLVMLGLFVAAPTSAGLAFTGGLLVTLFTYDCPLTRVHAQTGLTGVNGVLLGCLWGLCPEVSYGEQLLATVGGAVLISLLFVGGSYAIRGRKWSLPVFTLPYILVAWFCLWSLAVGGGYHLSSLNGWLQLAAHDYEGAKTAFSDVARRDPRIMSLRADGLGWVAFHQQDFATALVHFDRALKLNPQLADAHVGRGWALLKQGRAGDAANSFEEALQLNVRSADAWNGVGWIALQSHKFDMAEKAFKAALRVAPFCAETHFGLAQANSGQGDPSAAQTYFDIGSFLNRFLSTRLQYVPLTQWLGWGLFLLAIGWHSRIALATVAAALVAISGAIYLWPSLSLTLGNLHCVYNLLAIALLLTGLYLPLRPWCLAWLILMLAATVLIWHWTGGILGDSNPPLLILPLNLVLVATQGLRRALVARGFADLVTPAELTASSPEAVLLYQRKVQIAQGCWDALRDAEQAQ